MMTTNDCSQNNDPLKLIREGTNQDQRSPRALDPAYAPVDERKPEHAMVFARAYAKYLQFYGTDDKVVGNWEAFFSQDVSAQLAIAAVQDVDDYKTNIKAYFDFLNDRKNEFKKTDLKNNLGYLFSSVATLAKQLDSLKSGLPNEIALKSTLQNLIQNQLAPAFKRLIDYYKTDLATTVPHPLIANEQPDRVILSSKTIVFGDVYSTGLSSDWIINSTDWNTYTSTAKADSSIYGSGTVFERINHIATHNLFTSVFDQFLKVYARIVNEAKQALEASFNNWDRHEPHYALFLAFLKLLEYARAETNTLTQRHLDFYYRDVLRLKEKLAEPSHAHLLVELTKHAGTHELKKGELFKAGKDPSGVDVVFSNDRDFVANQAKVTALKTLYRHKNLPHDTLPFQHNRLFASQIANSDDGMDAKLTSLDQSWHPFFNKTYEDGKLTQINMPQAEVGFAIASHYLWLAEGTRTITVEITQSGTPIDLASNRNQEIICCVTAGKGWFECKQADTSFTTTLGVIKLAITLSGAGPAVIPYSSKIHGYNFATTLPMLLVKLRHQNDQGYLYPVVQDIVIKTIDLTVDVKDLKSFAVSNDFGPVDTSKPFQPFGASPIGKSALVIGSKEVFQKTLKTATINIGWQNSPNPYNNKTVNINIKYLQQGKWQPSNITTPLDIKSETFLLSSGLDKTVIDDADFSAQEFYNTSARHGFVRLETSTGFGQSDYENELIDYIKSVTDTVAGNERVKPIPPVGPFIAELTLDYTTAKQTITLNSNNQLAFEKRQSHFFHVTPFGQSEQHPVLNSSHQVFLVPQFSFQRDNTKNDSNAEFYIGITSLKPPQNLALFIQVVDGTENPLSRKPNPHIHWSYLRGNEWISFSEHDVQDDTGGLLNSGIITFSIPDETLFNNSLLPSGQLWLRAAVAALSDAVCRLQMVAGQGLTATFENHGNDPAFPATTLPAGTISNLDQPDAAVKNINQPFQSFGGRGAEQAKAFYTRVSERLRHKDRAIALWDYEHLILEAFPKIYQAKCLNHTQYEKNDESGIGIYRELAPGHLTVVTIPNQQFHKLRDPLRPYTGLGLLQEIAAFLSARLSCFVKLHVRNPQFEEIRVVCKVKYHTGFDETFYTRALQQAITRFLSPWAYDSSTRPSFGGKIYKSVLINFVEELPYVDYVTDFQLFHDISLPGTADKIEVEGSRAISILVSAPAEKHHIDVIKSTEATVSATNCPCESI